MKSLNHNDRWLGDSSNENCSLISDCADHHIDFDSGGDDHCGDSLWSQWWCPQCTMLFPMSIDILKILKSKNSFLAHFLSKTIIFPLNDAKVSKF